MSAMRVSLAAAAAVALAASAMAQPAAEPVSASMQAKVCELLDLVGTANLARLMTDQTIETFRREYTDVPAEFWDEFRASVDPSELQALIVPIYARHFDEDELEGILTFYRSPLGAKLLRELPLVARESMESGASWSKYLVNKLLERLKAKGYRTGP